jgi:hypothetical protein
MNEISNDRKKEIKKLTKEGRNKQRYKEIKVGLNEGMTENRNKQREE